ncbi:helix-turn-helix transcriptional regulator [Candidatus Tisiphia endosymbiont of Myopa tessellatipennis]|uniref:helix-turn-helix domain-containing protein n=1 Tax=Candidatus Tisiphia endosymbiont of Myopa tessellatipennis TaxID=3066257 RepID=UPI00313B68B1
MSYTTLQKNLDKIIKDRNYQVTELERKAGLKKNNIYNILKGISKKPSAELLQTVADVLGVTVKDLYNPFIETKNYLNNDDFELMEKILKTVIEEIKNLKLEVTEVDLVNIMLEVFNYSKPEPKKELEKRFINWILQQRIQKK